MDDRSTEIEHDVRLLEEKYGAAVVREHLARRRTYSRRRKDVPLAERIAATGGRVMLTARDVQAITGLSTSAAYNLMTQLGGVSLGRSLRLPKQNLDAHLKALERARWTSTLERSAENASGTQTSTSSKAVAERAREEAQASETMEPQDPDAPPKSQPELSSNRLRLAKIAARAKRRWRKR